MQVGVFAEIGCHADHIGTASRELDERVSKRRRPRLLSLPRNRGDHGRGGQARLARILGRNVKIATDLMTEHLRLTEVLTLQSLKLQDAAVA
ncbi:hypothetical protein XI05_07875 [Bradyrhizobium sp. CCBAU 11357]|nr:hypothetical protein [Bradyrhizobium sp. CCBAU 11357]